MKESVVRDLIGANLARLVNAALQGVHTDAYAGKPMEAAGVYSVQSPVAITQLACSPATQILSFFTMETDSMVRLGKIMLPGRPRDEALKLVISANAEVLNFVSSRLAWLLSKLENSPETEISPPRVANFTGNQAFRIRTEEGIFYEFACPSRDLAFKFAASIQSIA